MAQIGRPRALSDAQRRDVCALISTGCGVRTAADYVGCSPSTIRREGIRNPEFYQQLRNSDLHCQVTPLQHLFKAAATNWRAAAWLLERLYPDRFGRVAKPTQPVELASAMIDKVLNAIQHEIKDDELGDRINLVVRTIVSKWQRDTFAAEHRRRDPARAKRILAEIEKMQQTSAPPAPAPKAPPRANTPNPLGFTQEDYDNLGNFDDDDDFGPEIDLELKRRVDNDEWPYKAGAMPSTDQVTGCQCEPPTDAPTLSVANPSVPETPPRQNSDVAHTPGAHPPVTQSPATPVQPMLLTRDGVLVPLCQKSFKTVQKSPDDLDRESQNPPEKRDPNPEPPPPNPGLLEF